MSEQDDEVDRKCDFLRNQAEKLTAECEALRMSLNTIHREHAAKIVCYAHDLLASRDEVTSLRSERDTLHAEVAGLRKERDELFAAAQYAIDSLKRKGHTYNSVHKSTQQAWRVVYPEDARPPFVAPERLKETLVRVKDLDGTESRHRNQVYRVFLDEEDQWYAPAVTAWFDRDEVEEISESGEPLNAT